MGVLHDLRPFSRALAFAITAAKFNWDPKIPFDQFDARSINNAQNARESQVYRDEFLASISDKLSTVSEETSIGPVRGALSR